MKKLFILSLLIVLSFVRFALVSADAWGTLYETDDFTVAYVQNAGGDAYVSYAVRVEPNATGITFTLPDADFNDLTSLNGSYDFELQFKDEDSVTLSSYDWEDLFQDLQGGVHTTRVSGEFHLDFRTLGVSLTELSVVYIIVPQSFDDRLFGSFVADYLIWLRDNDTVLSTFGYTDYYYEYSNYYSYNARLDIRGTVPYGTDSIYFSDLDIFYTNVYGVYYSRITFYNSAGTQLESLFLKDIDADLEEFIVFPAYDTYDYDDVATFTLSLYARDPYINHADIWVHNEAINVDFNSVDVREIHFISQGEEVHSRLIYLPAWVEAYEVEPPPTGFIFNEWRTYSGDVFLPAEITAEDYPAYDIYAYASYTIDSAYIDSIDIGSGDDPSDVTDNPIQAVMIDIGWDTDTGYMLFFFISISAVTIFLAVILKVHMIGTVLIDFLVLILFHYWGMLPYYVSVIGFILFAVMGIFAFSSLRGGGQEIE